MTPDEIRPLVEFYVLTLREAYNPNDAPTPTGIVRPKTKARQTDDHRNAETLLTSIVTLVTGHWYSSDVYTVKTAWWAALEKRVGRWMPIPDALEVLTNTEFVDAMLEALAERFDAFKTPKQADAQVPQMKEEVAQ